MYPISYICNMENRKQIRSIFWTKEFSEFFNDLPIRVQEKFDYVISVVQTEYVISTKFVKRLVDTDLYEMRVSVGTNEYRTVLFTMDNENVMLATKIVLLNAFLKKSEKDYKNQIKIAQNILGGLKHDED